MTRNTGNRQFIDSVIREIIQPGTNRLLESRYFSDLRAGKLTTRRCHLRFCARAIGRRNPCFRSRLRGWTCNGRPPDHTYP